LHIFTCVFFLATKNTACIIAGEKPLHKGIPAKFSPKIHGNPEKSTNSENLAGEEAIIEFSNPYLYSFG
jgi:hypothetical protein